MSKVVRVKVEDELGKTENKVEYLTELAGTPPPLEEIDAKQRSQTRIGENEIGVRSAV